MRGGLRNYRGYKNALVLLIFYNTMMNVMSFTVQTLSSIQTYMNYNFVDPKMIYLIIENRYELIYQNTTEGEYNYIVYHIFPRIRNELQDRIAELLMERLNYS